MNNTTYIALLRGINVGGKGIVKMAELKALFEKISFTNVATYIQSGNVLFCAEETDRSKLSAQIESGIFSAFGITTKATLISSQELSEVVEHKPEGFGEDNKNYKYDVVFVIDPVTPLDVQKEMPVKEGVDIVFAGKKVVYIARLKKELTKSRFMRIIQTPVYQYITIRNWNTVTKLGGIITIRNSAK